MKNLKSYKMFEKMTVAKMDKQTQLVGSAWADHSTGFKGLEDKIKNVLKATTNLWKEIDSFASGGGFYHIVVHLNDGRVLMFYNDNAIFISSKSYKNFEDYNNEEDWKMQTGLQYNVDLDTASVSEIVRAIESDNIIDVTGDAN